MTSDDLYALFRSDMVDAVAPYLWSDLEVWGYMDDAYKLFARHTGGIPDSTSVHTLVPVKAGAATATVSPLILSFKSAYLLSSGQDLQIINEGQRATGRGTDYGRPITFTSDRTPGRVHTMVTGVGRSARGGQVRWVRVPEVDDTVQLAVMRLPLDKVEPGFEFDEIGEQHHRHLLLHMKALAYDKQDAECFDRGRRDEYAQRFRAYCQEAKSEWGDYKSHTLTVGYGGL